MHVHGMEDPLRLLHIPCLTCHKPAVMHGLPVSHLQVR